MRVIELAHVPGGYALALHGGAGGRTKELTPREQVLHAEGLEEAYRAGQSVLASGGSALDAVCASVRSLEDCPLFNAGKGAALTAEGEAELDASVMVGSGRAGAIATSRRAKNPVLAARKVMEETAHVLLVAPSEELISSWGLETVEPEYFITAARQEQLKLVKARRLTAPRHGTVGAVALDGRGHLAAATSTGGIVNQHEGRIGDTPVIGAGNYARDDVVAVSCTGDGEAFLKGVVAHDIYARMNFAHQSLPEAVAATITSELASRGAEGGIIAIGADGRTVVAYNTSAMFAAYEEDGKLVTLT